MKRILSILIIILLVPFLVMAQENKETETAQPESFFNDLIKTLNPSIDSTKKATAVGMG